MTTSYEFVTGDLDKIKIDGSIMPFRSGNGKKILRGEDIAFLMEASGERYRLGNPNYSRISTFSHKVCTSNFAEITHGWWPGQTTWVNSGYTFNTFVFDERKFFTEVYSDAFNIGTSRSRGEFAASKIRMDYVEALFYDISKMVRRYSSPNVISPSGFSLVEWNPDIGKAGGEWNPQMPGKYFDTVWSYTVERWGEERYWDVSNQGSAKWNGCGNVFSVSNNFASSADIIVEFLVESKYYDEGRDDVRKYIWKNVGRQSGGHIFLTYQNLVNIIESSILPTAGVSVIPYPGRGKGETVLQYAFVSVESVHAVLNLRDRTRW